MSKESLPPSLRDRFEVLGELGRGSFGRVLDVRDRDGSLRALKLLEGDLDLQRLGRELKASQAIRHPHVLEVLEVGLVDGVGFLLMERAEGTLQDWMAAPARRADAWEAMRQVAGGLAALHAEDIVHRDLKPENVMMVAGAAKLGDLGLAKGGDLHTLTQAGWVMGTPAYMAPEQARGEALTPAADVFALGVILFEVAAGRLPYPSTTPRQLLPALARGGPTVTGSLPANIPEVVRACLDPDPSRRPSAASLARDLGPAPRPVGAALQPSTAPTRRLVGERLVSPGSPAATPSKGVAARNMTATTGRNLLGVGLLAVAVAAGLSTLGRAPEAPPSATSTPSVEPLESAWPAPLGPDFGERARRELEKAKETFRDEGGQVHTLAEVQGPLPAGWRPLLDPDPASFPAISRAVPTLATWYAWLAQGGRVEDLGEEARHELRDLDHRYEAEELTRPFTPWLDLAPSPVPVAYSDLFLDADRVVRGPPVDGWAGTFVARLRRTLEEGAIANASAAGYFRGEPTSFPGAVLEGLRMRQSFHIDSPEAAARIIWMLDEPMAVPSWRVALAAWYQPFTTEAAAMVHAACRALRENPEDARWLIPLLDVATKEMGTARYGGWWALPPETLAGGPFRTARELVLLAVLEEQFHRTRREFGAIELQLNATANEVWIRPFQAPGASTLRDEPWFPWLVRNRLRSEADAERPWPELVALRQEYASVIAHMKPRYRAEIVLKFAEVVTRQDPPAPATTRARYRDELEAVAGDLGEALAHRVPRVLTLLDGPSH